MRNTLFGLLSVVVLAAALTVGPISVTPVAEAQFASNNRSVKLRETAAANVATPASGYASVFKDSTYGAFMAKDSGGLVHGIMGKVPITAITAATTLTAAHLGEVLVFNSDAPRTITLPEITASNIGMRYFVIAEDTDDLTIIRAVGSDDTITDAADGVVDADHSCAASTAFTTVEFIAISATQWVAIVHAGTLAVS